jgi:hypothetical protein
MRRPGFGPSLCRIVVEKSVIGARSLSPPAQSTSILPCQYHYINVPYIVVHLTTYVTFVIGSVVT